MIATLGEALRRAQRHAEASASQASRAESSFVDSEARADAVLDTTMSAIISIDATGRIATFNQAPSGCSATRQPRSSAERETAHARPYQEEHDDYLRRYLRAAPQDHRDRP